MSAIFRKSRRAINRYHSPCGGGSPPLPFVCGFLKGEDVKEHTRRAVAYIVGRLITDMHSGAVYDYSAKAHYPFSGEVSASRIEVYDCMARCAVNGGESGGGNYPLREFFLYHYGNAKHLSVEMRGNGRFEGFDYDSERHYSGFVNGNLITLFDYEFLMRFNYLL